ncbi:type III restriction enzyme, res subunit [Hirsutella rhossiliensis]|uniref:Type III restriction enzyme, res subunit domain-containing protein n=1 Tax=Hirsutella rhossiliensis TaxID=111463 RepID=A0A9P8N6R0_9HYPO|nr:type III restriction enzyme, res subunit domain-containing protein [Hirsutella rhossiliensis]KAH0966809.1 type III restriction enzyme, res subunit domain-containing protein [Hirsutella rhossiliensis]
MKRYLVDRGRKEALLRQGLVDIESSTSSDTLREIEAEKAEVEQAEALRSQNIVEPERVHVLLQEAVDGFREHWEHAKLPKHQRKAHKIWTEARKRGTKTYQVLQARQLAKAMDDRLHKLWTEIVEQTWVKESEVRLQARSLEQSVEDKQYNLWLAATLDSRIEPPKPDGLPRPKRPAIRRPQSPIGSEVLTSSDEEDFIVPDHEPEAMDVDHALPINEEDEPAPCIGLTPMKPESPTKADSPMFVDLTQTETPQSLRRARRLTSVIDLTATPIKPRINFRQVPSQDETGSIPTPMEALADGESFESVEEIGTQSAKHWAKLRDSSRLLICLLWKLPHARRTRVFEAVRDNPSDKLFALSIEKHLSEPLQDADQVDKGGPEVVPFDITRLFLSYIRVSRCKPDRVIRLSDENKKKLAKGEGETWDKFHAFLSRIEPEFPQDSQIYRTDAFDVELRAFEAELGTGALSEAEDDAPPGSKGTPSKTRKNAPKEIVQNKDAVDLREREKRRVEEQEARRLKLRASLNTSGLMSRDKSRLIINETKQEDQPFIYVNEETGKRIKDHQVDGVRFLWNQIVLDADVRQGCLLAHTMGLGKTMQVITFLAAIQESAKSADPAVTAQIPEDLRESKTLVLCPAGLVDNWMDELLLWAPQGLFGPIRKIESLLSPEERRQAVHTWAQEGGILVTGYNMLQKIVAGDEETEDSLITGPNIVVADEAHVLKNPEAKVHRVCSRFKTNCRIALTGSPLANNVEEYYSMINWVAPNYLGPLGEFKDIYALPIQQGLWGDSMGWEKRKALKMLQVLKETVAPKVHRRTIKSLKNDLPPKFEFVICVPPTAMQRKLYELYVSGVGGEFAGKSKNKKLPQAQIFTIVGDLGLLCNHPRCFQQKMLDARRDRQDGKPGLVPESVITSALKETNSALDLNNPGLSLKAELLSLILDEAREARDKVLVFSQSIPTLDYLMNLLQMQKRRVCRLDGGTAIGKRQDMTKNFNAGDQEAYLISTNAGGVGLNIQGASRVVIFDFKWNPVNDQQAIGRAYRIGQEKPVFVYRFVVAGTFEEDLQNKAVFKMQLASRVVDKKNPVSWSKRLGSLLHPINPVPAKNLEEFVGKDRILDRLIKYKNSGEAIRSIVSTDTFEEEDPDVDLTAEERRDAEDMVRLNRLRATDPEEYERKREEESRRLLKERINLTQQHDQSVGHQIQARPGAPAATQALAPLPIRGAINGSRGAVASSSTTALNGFTTQTQQSGFVDAQRQQAAAGLSRAQSSSSHLPSTATPLPMAGANTYFGNEPPPGAASTSEATPVQTIPSTPVPIASSAGPKLFNSPQGSQARDAFEQKLRGRLNVLPAFDSAGAASTREYIARDVTMAIDKIRKEHAFGFLPDNQHWRLLEEHLVHDRFMPAVVFGHITPSFLALTNRKELESRVAVLNSLSEQELQNNVMAFGGNSDPQV